MRSEKRFFGFVKVKNTTGLMNTGPVLLCWLETDLMGSIVIDQHQISTNGASDQSGQNLDRHGFKNAAVQAVEPPVDGQCADENAGCPADPGWSVFRDAHARIIPHLERR
jgi:hypothetical protein